jgi:multidrug resistance protein, MATE family
VCVPICFLWWTIEPLLKLAGQDPEVSALASTYLRVLSFGVYPLFLFEIAKKYLQAMSIVLPITAIMAVTLLFDIVMTYVLIWPMGLGFVGSPLAMSLSNYMLALLSGLYVSMRLCGLQARR